MSLVRVIQHDADHCEKHLHAILACGSDVKTGHPDHHVTLAHTTPHWVSPMKKVIVPRRRPIIDESLHASGTVGVVYDVSGRVSSGVSSNVVHCESLKEIISFKT